MPRRSPPAASRPASVTADQRQPGPKLSEEQAADALQLLDERDDPVIRTFRDAPLDDEPWTEADEAAMAEVEADRAAGIPTISLEQLKRELGDE